MHKCLFWLSHCLTHWLIRSFLPQKIVMHHLKIILYWMLNHHTSRLCILEKNAPSIEPCETPSSIVAHKEYCLLTLYIRW